METFWQDLRYGLRMLLKNPGFTTVAVLTLALGIGVNTALFSLVDAILLRPLPVPDSDRLVSIYHRSSHGAGYLTSTSYPNYEYYRDHNSVFSDLMAFARLPMSLRIGDQTEKVSGELVTANYFSVLGINAVLGRTFLPEEEGGPGARAVVVLNHDFWQRRFGRDPNILGRTIRLHRHSFTVVGVAPPGFRGTVLDWGDPPQLWVLITMHREAVPALSERFDPLRNRGMDWLLVVGRLKPGVTFSQAQTDLATLNGQLKQEHPDTNPEFAITLLPTHQARFWPDYRRNIVTYLSLLMTVAGLVLLIACFNVANLMLARARKRQKEVAVRLALGATGRRLVRQLLTESALLALLGGAAGLLVAHGTIHFLLSFQRPFGISLAVNPALDGRVLGFCLLVSLLTSLIFGLAPARQAAKLDLVSALKLEAPPSRLGRLTLQGGFIVAQVALSLLLLIGAGLFFRTLQNARAVDVTQDPGRVLLAKLELATHGYSSTRARLFYLQLLDRVRSLPEVRSAGLVWIVPLSGLRGARDVIVNRADAPLQRQSIQVNTNVVSPGYFQTIGIPIVHGRDLTDHDDETSPAVAIINEEMARRFWPGEDPIGKQFHLTNPPSAVQIVGLVKDGKMRNIREEKRPCFYLPLYQHLRGEMSLHLRAAGDPGQAAAALRREVQALDKDLPLTDIKTMKAHLGLALSQERMAAALLSALGLLALALAAIGIYGIIAYSVSQRTHEIGIRMALGAQPLDVLTLVLRQGMMLVVIGIALGLLASFAATRFISSLLFGVHATDPVTFVAISLLLTGVALLASYIPARKATRVDPMVALRYE